MLSLFIILIKIISYDRSVLNLKLLFNANRSHASLQLLSALLFIYYSLNSHAQADTYESEKPYNIQWETDITSYSPTQSIDSFTDDWDEPLENGDFAYIQGRSDIRYSTDQSPLSYALNYRYDYLLSFNPATAQVYWNYKNNKLPSENRRYPLTLTADYSERLGFGIANQFELPKQWQITPQLNIWQGLHGLTGTLKGDLTTKTAYNEQRKLVDTVSVATIDLSYQYDKPALKEDRIGWQPNQPNGIGYSLDLHINGKLPYDTTLMVDAYDILGKMYWHDMPMTDYNFNYSAIGRPPYTLEGQLSKKDLSQNLPWHVQTAIEKRFTPAWSLGLHSEFNDVANLHQLALTHHTQFRHTPLAMTGLLEPQTKAIGVQVKHKDFGISYLADDLKLNDAKRVALNFFVRHDW